MLFFDLLYILVFLISLPRWIKYVLKKEYRSLLKHRLSPDITPGNEKRTWIHAVSVGEVRSLKNLIQQLKQKYKGKEIVLSVTTPAGYEFAKQQYPNIHVINAPVDFTFTIKKFIKKINPQLLVLNELEIWPNWILITKKRNIPILLVNGRVSDSAFKRYKTFTFFLKLFFNKIDRFLVQTEIYKERFQQLTIPADRIVVCGNIKADEAFNTLELLPADREILDFLEIKRNAINGKKIVTIASSHLADEKLVIPIINKFKKEFLFIIVPRHLTRVEEIETLLRDHRVHYATWSKTTDPGIPPGTTTLVFDRMGYLFNVLKISDIVFMGGTLEPKIGGHNLYEPAVLGKLIVGGPCYNNFPAIGAELTAKGVYHIVNNPEELARFLGDIEKIDFEKIKQEAETAVSTRRGSIECTLKEIHPFIN